MKLAQKTTLGKAIGAFLRAEFDSPTEAHRLRASLSFLGLSESILIQSDHDDTGEDAIRWSLFQHYRGAEDVFAGLDFTEPKWHWALMTHTDLRTRTRTCRNHFERTFGTRSLAQVAAIIDRQVPTPENPVMQRIQKGERLEPPLLIANAKLETFVVLEGHNRLISYLREPTNVAFPITVIAGISENAAQWSQW